MVAGLVQITAEGIRETGFTGTGNTFQDQKLTGCHTGDKAAYDLTRIIQASSGWLQTDGILLQTASRVIWVLHTSGSDTRHTFHPPVSQLRKTMCRDSASSEVAFSAPLATDQWQTALRLLLLAAASVARCAWLRCAPATISGYIFHSRNHIIGQGRSPHIRNPLCAAHGVDLQGQNAVLLIHQRKHLLVQTADFFVKCSVVCFVCLQLMMEDYSGAQMITTATTGTGKQHQHQKH